MNKILPILIIFILGISLVLGQNLSIQNKTNNQTFLNKSKDLERVDEIEMELENRDVMLPNQFGYEFGRFLENARLFFTFSVESRIDYRINLAEKRMVEIHKSIEKNLTENLERVSKDYNKTLGRINNEIGELRGREITNLNRRISNMTRKHLLVLERNLNKVSEQGKEKILTAINASEESYIKSGGGDLKRLRDIRKEIGGGEKRGGRLCAQVITPAMNPETGECRDFPNPCVVPENWEKVSSCNSSINNSGGEISSKLV